MNNNLVNGDNISKLPPHWGHPILPPNSVQGSLLFVVNPFVEPPQDSGNFRWLPMEDIIGVALTRLDFDEKKSEYHLYQAKGHLNNDGEWVYEWQVVGTWAALTDAVKEALEKLVYYEYIFDTSEENVLKVIGVRKDETRDTLCTISFTSKGEFDYAIEYLQTQINNINEDIATLRNDLTSEINRATERENQIEQNLNTEIDRATAKENELEENIEENRIEVGTYGGISVEDV